MPSLARKNLLEDIPRFLVAELGIIFAVGLVTIQWGVRDGFVKASSEIIDRSQADIWVSAKNNVELNLTLPLPHQDVIKAKQVEGVQMAEGFIIYQTIWRNIDNQLQGVTILGSEPDSILFKPWNVTNGSLDTIKEPYSVLVDQETLSELGVKQKGDVGIVGILPANIAGFTQKTKSVILGPLIFTSLPSAKAYMTSKLDPRIPCDYAPNPFDCYFPPEGVEYPPAVKKLSDTDPVSYILIKIKPDQDIITVKTRLEKALPHAKIWTKSEMSKHTQVYWEKRSGIGPILGIGSSVGIVVCIVIVSQILYSSVSDHLKEFGTLKAIGASNRVIYAIILEQALLMSLLGYIPGIALCLVVAGWVSTTQGILIIITPLSAGVVFALTVGMCVVSAVVAIDKVRRVEPAMVFKG